ncbi:MAG: ABC transporter substrate-binding protein [Thermoplasmatota archaeon]
MKGEIFSRKLRVKQVFSIVLVSLLVLGALSLTGCVDDEGEENTFNIGYVGEPKDFHPIRYTAGMETGQFLQQIFDPLLVTYYDGKPNAGGQAVAESYQELDDGMRYTFEIEEGIKFHNGDELKADDVKFTIDTMRMGKDSNEYFELYNVDKNPDSVRKSQFDAVESVETTGDYSLEIKMKELDAEFLSSDGFENIRIVPLDYIEENGWDKFDEELIGTGPYEFKHYKKGDEIVMTKFDDAHVEVKNIDKIVVKFYGDESSAVTAMRNGDIDFMPSIDAMNYQDLKNVDDVKSDSYELGGTMYVAFNQQEGNPTNNTKVRKAIAYALDVNEIIQGTSTDELVKNERALVPDIHPAYPDNLNMYEQDKAEARKLLDEAGYSDGLTLEFYAWDGSDEPLPIIQEQLEDVGIETNINALEWGGFMDAMEAGEPDIMYTGWPGAASAKYMMGWLTQDHYDIQWSLYYNSTAYTEKMEQAYQTVDFDERMNLYKEAQRILVNDEMGLFNLWTEEDEFAYRTEVEIPENAKIAYTDGPLTHLHLFELDK